MKLEYFFVYKQDGTPAYSKCFGDFCASPLRDEELFGGLVSSLASLPRLIKKQKFKNLEDKHMEVGSSKMFFKYLTNFDLILAAGFNKDNYDEKRVNEFLKNLEISIRGKYNPSAFDQILTSDQYEKFEETLIHEHVEKWFTETNTEDTCPQGDDCPFRQASANNDMRQNSIWDGLKKVYSKIKASM